MEIGRKKEMGQVLSLKERFAAKKAAKAEQKNKQQHKQVVSDYKHNKNFIKSNNRKFSLRHKQARENALLAEKDNRTTCSDSEITHRYETMIEAFENLVSLREMPQTIAMLETVVRAGKILTLMLQDVSKEYVETHLKKDVEQAEYELLNNAYRVFESEADRRHHLRHILYVIDALSVWHKSFTKEAIKHIECYNTGLQICAYYLKFYQRDNDTIVATHKISLGHSLRECAKAMNRKENELRESVLQAAKYIYKISLTQTECNGITPPQSITDLRQDGMQWLLNFDNLRDVALTGFHHWAKPFSEKYGIDLLNLAEYAYQLDLNRLRLLRH